MSDKRQEYIAAHVDECIEIRRLVNARFPDVPERDLETFVTAVIESLFAMDAADQIDSRLERVERTLDDINNKTEGRR
jgi:hypothetical protein